MMKIELNEKMKHRIIGLAVLLSIAAIFMPAIVKKSTQRSEREISLNLKLPQRPEYPQISENTQTEALKQDIAQLEDEIELSLESDVADESSPVTIAKAEPIDLSVLSEEEQTILKDKPISTEMKAERPVSPSVPPAEKITTAKLQKPTDRPQNNPLQMAEMKRESIAAPKTSAPPKKQAKAAVKTKLAGNYSVQLGSFSMPANANALVKHLKDQGFSAKVKKVKTKKGYLYKVYVGNAVSRYEAEKLKNRLAENTKLSGFVVSGVS